MDISWLIFWILTGLFFIVSIVILVIFLYRLKWNVKWVKLEEQPNGKLMLVKSGRCRLIAFGDGGEEIYFLKGVNKIKVAYGKKIGVNQIAWAVGQDGYWYNSDFGGIDKKLKEIGVFPVHMDMRYAHATIRKGNDRRHKGETFMEKWGTTIAFGMLAICIISMIVFSWYTFKGVKEAQQANTESLKIQEKVMETTNEVITKLNAINLANQPSGVRTVNPV